MNSEEFKQLYSKNFKIWTRGRCGWLCDVITTVVFAGILILISSLIDKDIKDATSYLPLAQNIGPINNTGQFPDNQRIQLQMLAMNPIIAGLRFGVMKNCTYEGDKSMGDLPKDGFVALAPESNPIIAKLKIFFSEVMKFRVRTFKDTEEIKNYINDSEYGGLFPDGSKNQICLGIGMNETVEEKWQYNLLYNATGNPQFADLLTFDKPQIAKFEYEDFQRALRYQVNNGIFYLVNFIDNEILRESTGKSTAAVNARFTYIPVPEIKKSTLYAYSNSGDISNFVTFSILVVFLGFVYNVLNEKEKGIAQNLRNMGMSMTSYYLSWICFYVTVVFLLSVIWLLMVKFTFFPDANMFLVWFLFFMTGLSFIGFGMFVIAFFEKAKPGTLCAIIVYFLLFGTNVAMSSNDNQTAESNRWYALSPVAGLAKAGAIVTLVQSYYQPFDFSLWNTDILSFRYSYFFWNCFFEFFILCILGIYLDQVIPKETQVRRHPLFCLMKKRSKDAAAKGRRSSISMVNDDFEELYKGLKAQKAENKTLEIRKLKKVYPNGKVAVDGLDLTMYSDQIFALLGHNGAGKTTTISMVSGLLPLTSGRISVLGYDAADEQDMVKTVMGVCPQKNPIYPSLTCQEHLMLYAKVKKTELQGAELQEDIDTILKDIDLYDKKNYPAGKLSGGQKRKLCVACAFIGGSKVILLDEPTSGMDVAARRRLWETLKKYKKDKIIILTTHFMDEADYLGDRIGVMGSGKLLTCGSSLFLKNRFGVGYSLTLVKSDSQSSTAKITEAIKSIVPGAELDGDISKEIKYILPTQELDKFEELFRSLENDSESLGIQSFGVSLTTLEDVFLKIAETLDENNKNINKGIEEVDRIMDEDEEVVELEKIRVKDSQIFGMHFGALTKKRLIYFKRDLKGLVCEIVVPIFFIFLGITLTLLQISSEPVGGIFEPSLLEVKPELLVNSGPSFLDKIDTSELTLNKSPQPSIFAFDQLMKKQIVPERQFAAYAENPDAAKGIYDYTLFVNTTSTTSFITGLNLMNKAILKDATGNAGADITINFIPLPLTEQTKNFGSTVKAFLVVFLISLALAFIPASMVMFVVKERENNAKYQQIVSGVSLSAYWFSNLLVDFIKYFIVVATTVGLFFAFKAEAFIDDGAIWMTVSLLFFCGPSLISFTYLVSFLFKSPSSAQIFLFIFSILTGFILLIATLILRVIPSTTDLSLNVIEWIISLFPMYQVCFGLYALVSRPFFQILFGLKDLPGVWSRYSALPQLMYSIFTTIIYIMFIFIIEISSSRYSKDDSASGYQFIDEENADQDEDVVNEANEVKNNDDYSIKVQEMSKVYTMVNSQGGLFSKKKLITRKAAVKNISFGVRKGECFGLLGTNGAGKTSTFKVLSGELQPTTGFVKVAGLNVATDMKRIRSLIGYCPQFDALLGKMTTREHLEMYAAIKGIPAEMRERMIAKMIKQLNLSKYEHVQAGTYSGGNKRKLSVAIALLGNPPIVFLDEPSSGMDPEARRFMWSVVGNISSKKKASSVVLTTHSMEEAEALSTKLAIMVEGRIKCIGAIQSLKNKYGKGFEIETKLKLPSEEDLSAMIGTAGVESAATMLNMEGIKAALINLQQDELVEEIREFGNGAYIYTELKKRGEVSAGLLMEFSHVNKQTGSLKEFMESTFGTVSVIEAYQSFIRWKVEDDVKLSELFGEMQRNKEQLNLSQYSVKQTSIEQIFLNFANEREAELEEDE